MKLSRSRPFFNRSTSIDILKDCLRARIPELFVIALAGVSNDTRFCARSYAFEGNETVRKNAHHDLTNVR